MSRELSKLLDEYKETARCMQMSADWLNDREYDRGKLDLVKVLIEKIGIILRIEQ